MADGSGGGLGRPLTPPGRILSVMRVSRRQLAPLALAAGLGLIPVAVLAAALYSRAVARGERQLAAGAQSMAGRCDRLMTVADATLTRLVVEHDGDPPARVLDRLEYRAPRFREFGVVDPAGRLVRTSRGELTPPVAVPPADNADPANPDTQVVGLIKTAVMGERSISIARPTGRGQGAVNLLVDPELFTLLVDDVGLGAGGFLAVATADGRPLAVLGDGTGYVDSNWLSGPVQAGRIRAARPAGEGRLRVVAEVDRGTVTAGVPRDVALVGLPVWLTTAGVVFWATWRRRAGLADDLLVGLARGEFAVHYQPIVELETYRWTGLEALTRWTHPTYGPVRPDVFIPLAEQAGLVGRLTEWLIDQAAVELAEVMRQLPDLYLSINLPPELVADGTAGRLVQRAERAGLSIRRLKFEVTERSLPAGPLDEFGKEVARLAATGVRFALDDFGVGYANYGHLSRVRFDAVKLDRSLIAERGDGLVQAVLDSVLAYGRRLNVRMVAEGVETNEQVELLRSVGVKYAQGWLFGRPMPASKLLTYLATAATPGRPHGISAENA